MSEYNINKITLPSGDICNLQDSHGLATLSNSGLVDCSGDSQSLYGRKVFVSIPTLSETVGIQTGKTTDTHTIPSAAIYFRDSEIPTSEDSALGRPAASVINLRPAVGSSVGNQLGFDVYHPNSAGTSYDGSADRFLLPAATTGSTTATNYNIHTSKTALKGYTYANWETATGTSGAITVKSYNITEAGVYAIAGASYQTTTGYTTAQRSSMTSTLTLWVYDSGGDSKMSVAQKAVLTGGGDCSVSFIFECAAGDTVRFTVQQTAGNSGATLAEQTFYVRSSMIRLV